MHENIPFDLPPIEPRKDTEPASGTEKQVVIDDYADEEKLSSIGKDLNFSEVKSILEDYLKDNNDVLSESAKMSLTSIINSKK